MATLDMASAGNIVYNTGLTDTPASGAPGAYKKMLANATATTPWWFVALVLGNLSGAGATAFDYQVARAEDGSGTDIVTDIRVLLEAATAALSMVLPVAFPVLVAAGAGAAARQTTASGKTLDASIIYATGLGT